jgi:FkbM family methyltransferase
LANTQTPVGTPRSPAVLRRIAQFSRRNAALFGRLRNWRDVAFAMRTGVPVGTLLFRNGISIQGTAQTHLDFLFTEIWVDRVYTPRGYEICEGQVVVDVGANVGVFSAFAALSARNVEVFAYEPFPENAALLRRNTAAIAQSRVHVFEQAVGGASGPGVLCTDAANWMVHSVADPGSASRGLPIATVSLDDLIAANGITRCDLLKLDCEGSEYAILRGARAETLERVERVVGEYHPLPRGFDGGSAEDVLRGLLTARGFRVDGLRRFPGEAEGGVFYARRPAHSGGRAPRGRSA